MSKLRPRILLLVATSIALLSTLGWLVSCGGGGTTPSSSTGTVNTSLSDPAACTPPQGNVTGIWVTVTKVTANIDPNAGPSGNGWQTLVDLTANPTQINLPNLQNVACILTTLGSTTGLPAGNYQQIRLYLLANNATGTTITTIPAGSNACGPNNSTGPFNCVTLSGGGVSPLDLSSQVQTGIKIPSGQIAGGQFTISAGKATDLNIDFNSCESIVNEGNGMFRLKPVLLAGEVSLNTTAISGKVTDSKGNGIANAIVLLETATGGVDMVQHQTIAAMDGTFIFCPLTGGPFDVVVGGTGSGVAYNPTVITGVPVGTALGNITLVTETLPLGLMVGTPAPATITGEVKTNSASAIDVTLSALQQAGSVQITVPVFVATNTTTSTAMTGQPPVGLSQGACTTPGLGGTADTDCFVFSLTVSSSAPQIGTVGSGGTITYTAPTSDNSASYTIQAQSGECTTTGSATSSSVSVASAGTANAVTLSAPLTLAGCTAAL